MRIILHLKMRIILLKMRIILRQLTPIYRRINQIYSARNYRKKTSRQLILNGRHLCGKLPEQCAARAILLKENLFMFVNIISYEGYKFFAPDFLDFIFMRQRRSELKYA